MSPVKKTGISVWPSGEDAGNNLSSVFIGPSWNLNGRSWDAYGDLTIPAINWGLFTTPAINLGRTGFQLRYGGSAQIGFDVKPSYNGGLMNLTYTGAVTVAGLPSLPVVGQQINLTLSYRTVNTSNFSVTTPTFGIGMDAVCSLSGNASATGWFLGQVLANGDLFTPFSVDQRSQIFPLTTLTQGDHVNQVAAALNGLNIANPLPISAQIAVPDLAVTGTPSTRRRAR